MASVTSCFHRHENDLSFQTKAVKASLDNSILLGKTMINRAHHLEEIGNKVMLDCQNTDPYWINSVNYVASYSRHNYVNVNKVV
jgi:hypothetical protein